MSGSVSSILARLGITERELHELAANGLAIMPIEPNDEMIAAGWYAANDENAAGVWRDMAAEARRQMLDNWKSVGR
jgi:hypothetical protein